MGALPTGTSQEDFYNDSDLHGGYQYVSLKDIINNFILMYTGDNLQIPSTINRELIIFHAKRGLQELNYDALKQIKGIEIDLSDSLTLILPEDYVKYVRVSWVDSNGNFHPMIMNTDTKIAEAYLQDNEYNILFDESGNVLKASQNSYDQTLIAANSYSYINDGLVDGYDNILGDARYGMDTAKANYNGWFTVDKSTGVMKFSTNVGTRTIVLEYISDGLESSDLSEIRVHKFAEEALYSYIEWQILDKLLNMQEYVVRRKHKKFWIEKNKAKTRLNGLTFDELYQALQGQSKRIK